MYIKKLMKNLSNKGKEVKNNLDAFEFENERALEFLKNSNYDMDEICICIEDYSGLPIIIDKYNWKEELDGLEYKNIFVGYTDAYKMKKFIDELHNYILKEFNNDKYLIVKELIDIYLEKNNASIVQEISSVTSKDFGNILQSYFDVLIDDGIFDAKENLAKLITILDNINEDTCEFDEEEYMEEEFDEESEGNDDYYEIEELENSNFPFIDTFKVISNSIINDTLISDFENSPILFKSLLLSYDENLTYDLDDLYIPEYVHKNQKEEVMLITDLVNTMLMDIYNNLNYDGDEEDTINMIDRYLNNEIEIKPEFFNRYNINPNEINLRRLFKLVSIYNFYVVRSINGKKYDMENYIMELIDKHSHDSKLLLNIFDSEYEISQIILKGSIDYNIYTYNAKLKDVKDINARKTVIKINPLYKI